MEQHNGNLQKRIPIRRRVMAVVLLTSITGLLAASLTGMLCLSWIKKSTERALTVQLERNLKSIVQQKAVSADATLEHYEKYIELVRDYIEKMYLDEEELIQRGRIVDPPVDTRDYALTRGLASEDLSAEELSDEIRFFSNLEPIWEPIAKENTDLITTVYLGTADGLIMSYDRWSYLSLPEGSGETVYNYFDSDWYRRGMSAGGTFFTGLYNDSQGRGLTLTVASPFHSADGAVAGVECADFNVTALYGELTSFDLGSGTLSFIIDRDGSIISPKGKIEDTEKYTGLTQRELDGLLDDRDGIMEIGNAVFVCIPIHRVGWTLCAGVPRGVIQSGIRDADLSIRYASLLFLAVAAVIIIIAVFSVNHAAANITHPMELLGRDMKIISDGDMSYRAKVYRNDEIGDITSQMNEMVDRLSFTMNELVSSQRLADAMSRLATQDALTGLNNKTAYGEQINELDKSSIEGDSEYSIVMIDLNNLKVTNDTYGHDKGDLAIKKLAGMIRRAFPHSPVFRIGGDEFVAVLKGEDYRCTAELCEGFLERLKVISSDTSLEPWERVSAAVGYAMYDEAIDTCADDVLTRADQEMYRCKRMMKMI